MTGEFRTNDIGAGVEDYVDDATAHFFPSAEKLENLGAESLG